jgi:predicted Zn-dependent protease
MPVEVDQPPAAPLIQPGATPAKLSARQAVDNFNIAVARIEPVAERLCRQRSPDRNCDFRIIVDDRPGQPVNAYQTLDRSGRPIIAFTLPLIADARNRDEIAFVMAHEAAHHIEGHIARQQANTQIGAVLLGGLAGALGATDQSTIELATRIGAGVGARSYSKEFELEADALGVRIAAAAGFDPLNGAQFFFRIPDPGDRFLGTHPANADRLRTVQRVAAGL